MKTPEQKLRWNKTGAIAILAFVAFSVALILSSCGSSKSAVSYHQGLQKELTFDNAVNNLETFTVKSAKEDKSALKKELKEIENRNQSNAKRKTIEQENAELRAKIEEAKTNNP